VKPPFVVHTEASLGWAGQEIRVLSETAGMMARGHRLLPLCPAEGRIHEEAKRPGLPVEALPIGRKCVAGLCALWRWLRALAPHLILTHSSTDSWLAALASCFWHGAPPMVRIRYISASVGRNAGTLWLYGRAAAHVVTTGERLRQDLVRDLGLPLDQATSVPTGIDLPRYAPRDKIQARRALGIPEGGLVTGIAATLRSCKGHRFLLEAWAGLTRGADDRLLVVGDGPGRDNLNRQAWYCRCRGDAGQPGRRGTLAGGDGYLRLAVLRQ